MLQSLLPPRSRSLVIPRRRCAVGETLALSARRRQRLRRHGRGVLIHARGRSRGRVSALFQRGQVADAERIRSVGPAVHERTESSSCRCPRTR